MKLLIAMAFIAEVVIWSFTPLGINWSMKSFSFGEAMFWRNLTAVLLVVVIVLLGRYRISFSKDAIKCYSVGGFQLYAAMTCVYLGSTVVSSGTVAVIHGVMPIIAAICSWFFFGTRQSKLREFLILISFAGLLLIFQNKLAQGQKALWGFWVVAMGVFFHAFCSTWIKKYNQSVLPFDQLVGSLLVCLPGYALNAFIWPGHSESIDSVAVWSILLLAVFGSLLGFFLFFFLLQHISSVTLGLISVLTPVIALWVGVVLNQEVYSWVAYVGSFITLVSVACFILEPVFKNKRQVLAALIKRVN